MKFYLSLVLSFFLGSAVVCSAATPTVTPVPTYQATPTVNDNGNNTSFNRSALLQLRSLVTALYTAIDAQSNSTKIPTAWAQCVLSGNVPTINQTSNIASCTSISAGTYQVTFVNAMANTQYAVLAQGEFATNSLNIGIPSINTRTTSGFITQFLNLSNTSSVSTACTPTAFSLETLGGL